MLLLLFLGSGFIHFIIAPAPPPTPTPPTPPVGIDWRCLMCEDVLQTYHDKYHCLGETLDLPPFRSASVAQANKKMKACSADRFSCMKLTATLQDSCFAMENYIASQVVLPKEFFELGSVPNLPQPPLTLSDHKQNEIHSAYTTCVQLQQCSPDPPPKPQLDETAPPILHPCHSVFLTSCGDDWSCNDFTLSCSKQCYLCTWVMRDWPRFQEYCKPQTPPTRPPPTPKPGAFVEVGEDGFEDEEYGDEEAMFIEDEEHAGVNKSHFYVNTIHVPQETNGHLASPRKERKQKSLVPEPPWRATPWADEKADDDFDTGVERGEAKKVFGVPNDLRKKFVRKNTEDIAFLQQVKRAETFPVNAFLEQSVGLPKVRSEACFLFWKYARTSRKAAYFAIWKRFLGENIDYLDRNEATMWDANVACKCLGHCSFAPFERLNLLTDCQYGEVEDQSMRLVLGFSRLLPHNITATPTRGPPPPAKPQLHDHPVDAFLP